MNRRGVSGVLISTLHRPSHRYISARLFEHANMRQARIAAFRTIRFPCEIVSDTGNLHDLSTRRSDAAQVFR
jgi:hypothetical protein